MSPLLPIAMFLLVAAITPGPNNLVVMRAAARSGWAGALPAVAGIVPGGLVLLAIVTMGAGRAFSEWPWLRVAVEAGGALYLVRLGVRLFVAAGIEGDSTARPAGLGGLFAFQFLNPKGWVMVLTVVAALPATAALETFLDLAPLFIFIPVPCLLLWAGLGGLLASRLTRPVVRRWTDRVLGTLLILAALLLFA